MGNTTAVIRLGLLGEVIACAYFIVIYPDTWHCWLMHLNELMLSSVASSKVDWSRETIIGLCSVECSADLITAALLYPGEIPSDTINGNTLAEEQDRSGKPQI